ncbi:rCG40478, isoform CRA_d [Rattus norvegicus]|nr:rCG40478, isoform CRA_d [Rattus norvegicus]
MESGAKGCEVVVSGKLRGQRAKSMKFVDGLMIHSGDPVNYYVDTAVRHVLLRQGVLGIKVKIMLPWDPSGKIGPKKPLPDHVSIVEPKDEILPTTPISEQKGSWQLHLEAGCCLVKTFNKILNKDTRPDWIVSSVQLTVMVACGAVLVLLV